MIKFLKKKMLKLYGKITINNLSNSNSFRNIYFYIYFNALGWLFNDSRARFIQIFSIYTLHHLFIIASFYGLK